MDILPSGEFPPVREKRKEDQKKVFIKGEGKTADNLCRGAMNRARIFAGMRRRAR